MNELLKNVLLKSVLAFIYGAIAQMFLSWSVGMDAVWTGLYLLAVRLVFQLIMVVKNYFRPCVVNKKQKSFCDYL